MFKAPPVRKLRNAFRKNVTLTQYTYGTEDSYGQKDRTVLHTYNFKAEVQEITSYDLSFFPSGTVQVGDAWGFFLPRIVVNGITVNISVEDELTWNSKTWRIDKIEDGYFGEHLWYRKALMRRKI